MPAATCRADLQSVTKREFAKLSRTLDTVSETVALQPFEDGVTIKDVIGHRAHWIGLFFGWVEDGRAGKDVHTPAPGYNWSQLKAYNAAVRQQQADLGWIDVRELLLDRHQALMRFIETEPEQVLYTPHQFAWMNDWTLGRWAEAAGASHYRSATKFVRSCLRQCQDASEAGSDNSVSRKRSNASRLTGSN